MNTFTTTALTVMVSTHATMAGDVIVIVTSTDTATTAATAATAIRARSSHVGYASTYYSDFTPTYYPRPRRDRYFHHGRFLRAQKTAIPARGEQRWRPVLYRETDGWRLSKHTHHVVAGL